MTEKKVLIVDNHPVLLKYLADLIRKNGHRVMTAPDGLTALNRLKDYVPDVIFLDLIMPNISGDKLCPILRKMPALKDARIIILSAIAAERDLDLFSLGADACIAKGPFDRMGRHVLAVLNHGGEEGPVDAQGKIIGAEDLYQREITKELLTSRAHFEVILSNMTEGILELTNDYRIVYANRAAVSLIGLPEEDLLGSVFSGLFPEDTDRMRIEGAFKDLRGETQRISEDTPVRIKDKELSLDICPPTDDGAGSIILILNDVTERRRMRERLLQARKMEAIATLAGGVAHEFNNALVGVTGNLELLRMDFPGNQSITACTDRVKTSVFHMVELTNKLLAFSRGGKYQSMTISLNKLVEETLPMIKGLVNPDIRIETRLAPKLSPVEGDFTQIQMVLSDLLENASEAIEGKGAIIISTFDELIDQQTPGGRQGPAPGPYACLRIQDTGRGMDEETRLKVFDPFFTTKFQGRGLGMAAVYGVVKNHRGWISMDSSPDRGTVVKVYLPSLSGSGAETASPAAAPGKDTVLLIDDEKIVAEVGEAMLGRLGYSVLTAATGAEAVSIARNFQGDIAVVLLDIFLPDMPARDVFQQITEARKGLKVLICSGSTMDGPAREILDAGAMGFIRKPFSLKDLSLKLKETEK